MEAFLAQVAAAAGKASDQGYSKQGRPPVQPKSAAAGRPVKKEGVRQRSPSAPARTRARNSHQEPNTHKHKTLDLQAAPNSAIPAICHFFNLVGDFTIQKTTAGKARRLTETQELLATGAGRTTICE